MFFMYLDILAKFSTDVLVIVDLGASHQFSGIDISGYTISQGVYVEPKIAWADHLNHQHSWQFLKGEGILDALAPFFQSLYASFHHWNIV